MANSQQNINPPPPPPYYMQQRKSRWWIPVLITIVVLIGFVFAFFAIVFFSFGSLFEKEPVTVKDNSVLTIEFMGKLEERANNTPFDFLDFKTKETLNDIITSIRNAKNDDRITGIYYKGGLSSMGFAKAEEIINAMKDFKKSGKFIYAYMNWGKELDYYLALPADKIFMPREGMIEMNGFAVTAMFFKGLLDKIGIDYFVLGFEDFKSAGEMYSRKNFSDSSRYQYQVILNSRLNHFVKEISESRHLDRDVILGALSRGIYSTDSLLALGFVDSLIYEDDVKTIIKDHVYNKSIGKSTKKSSDNKDQEEKLNLISVANYSQNLPEIRDKKLIATKDKQIAIIYASGPLVEQVQDNFSNELNITSKQFIRDLKSARENKDIKVIIIRIDSPGGAVLTSDAIYNEIIKTKKIKPIYASMSDVAASGGYYIAAPCDTIIASPSTITGSIGVVMAVPNLSKLMENIYISIDTVSTGESATQLSGLVPFREEDKIKVKNIAHGVYERFISKVAKNRKKSYEEIHALAKGRVWTGEDAYDKGLIDVLGGFETAISLAKKRMGVPDSMKVYIQEYPRKQDEFQELLNMFGLGDSDEEASIDLPTAMTKYFGKNRKEFLPFYNALPENVKDQLKYMITLLQLSERNHVLMALPEKAIIE